MTNKINKNHMKSKGKKDSVYVHLLIDSLIVT